MRNLKYKGCIEKDEVHIDMMKMPMWIVLQLETLIGKIPSPLPGGVLKVKFYVYKKKESWIEVNDKRIDFIYTLRQTLRDSENDYYLLTFTIKRDNKSLMLRCKDVKQDCYPKKELIKFLLEELIK